MLTGECNKYRSRKITIYDTSPQIFRRFLLYLYGAPVDKNVGLESICELMLLADRYSVDSLKVSFAVLLTVDIYDFNFRRFASKL